MLLFYKLLLLNHSILFYFHFFLTLAESVLIVFDYKINHIF